MKRTLAFTLIGLTTVTIACNKNNSGPSAGYGPKSLFPTTNGDTWYYNDSAFSDTTATALVAAYPDTMVATKTAVQDNAGTVYLEMHNPNGWFTGSYISIDPSNTAVYEEDSITNFQPYTMFALVNQDGPVTQPYTSSGACPITYNQVGYAAAIQAYGFSCYKNTETVTDCNNVVLEQTDYYLSPGVGVVRVDDWLTDTTGGKKTFYEDYSQTLTGKALK